MNVKNNYEKINCNMPKETSMVDEYVKNNTETNVALSYSARSLNELAESLIETPESIIEANQMDDEGEDKLSLASSSYTVKYDRELKTNPQFVIDEQEFYIRQFLAF